MSFKEIKGQDRALLMLQRAIQTDRVAHGYLFVGPEGVGKRLMAKNFAKALNCETPILEAIQQQEGLLDGISKFPSPSPSPQEGEGMSPVAPSPQEGEGRGEGAKFLDCCDRCPPCRKIDSFNHIDVGWLEPGGSPHPNPLPGGEWERTASGSIKIEQIRQLQDQLILKPYEAKYKVYIISKAETMTEEASNALLKSLEEPPPHSILILTSSDKDRLLSTITSRCQIVKFSNLKKELVVQILTQDFGIEPLAASFLAAVSEAGLGEALRFAWSLPAKEPRLKAGFEEQVHIGTGEEPPQPSRIYRQRVFFQQGADILEKKNRVIDSFLQWDLKEPQEESWLYKQNKESIEVALQILLWWYRDLLVLKQSDESRLLANLDRKDELLSESNNYSSHQLRQAIDIITQTASLIHNNANPRLALGVMAMELVRVL